MPSSLIRGRYVIARAGSDAQSSTVITDGAVYQKDGVIEDVGQLGAWMRHGQRNRHTPRPPDPPLNGHVLEAWGD